MGEIVLAVATAIVGVVFIDFCVAGFVEKPISMVSRGLFLVGGILMVIPSLVLSLIGLGIGALAMVFSLKGEKGGAGNANVCLS